MSAEENLLSFINFQKKDLDLVLVPIGLLIMVAYHLRLPCRCIYRPNATIIVFDNKGKKAWVDRIMKVDNYNPALPLTVLSSNIRAATFFAAVSLTLSIFDRYLGDQQLHPFSEYANLWKYKDIDDLNQIYKSPIMFPRSFHMLCSISKILITYANYLVSVPIGKVPVELVELAVIRGRNFWSPSLRAINFALLLLLWFLSPILMLLTSLAMVCFLCYLDKNITPDQYNL